MHIQEGFSFVQVSICPRKHNFRDPNSGGQGHGPKFQNPHISLNIVLDDGFYVHIHAIRVF